MPLKSELQDELDIYKNAKIDERLDAIILTVKRYQDYLNGVYSHSELTTSEGVFDLVRELENLNACLPCERG